MFSFPGPCSGSVPCHFKRLTAAGPAAPWQEHRCALTAGAGGEVSSHPGNKTSLFLRKPSLSPMPLPLRIPPGAYAESLRQAEPGCAARGSLTALQPPLRRGGRAQVCRQLPPARPEGTAAQHPNPDTPASCSLPAAGAPQGGGCVDFGALHEATPPLELCSPRSPLNK